MSMIKSAEGESPAFPESPAIVLSDSPTAAPSSLSELPPQEAQDISKPTEPILNPASAAFFSSEHLGNCLFLQLD